MTGRVLGFMLALSGMLIAQQPAPAGISDESARNYMGADGTVLTDNSGGDELMRALQASYANNPEFRDIRVKVKHHRVTLEGTVLTKGAKGRAQRIAAHTAGVQDVNNRLKIGDSGDSSLMGAAH